MPDMTVKELTLAAAMLVSLTLGPAAAQAAPDMVLVAGGSFSMGSDLDEALENEKPAHQAAVNSFYIGKYEVTFDEYDEFCTATGRNEPKSPLWGRGQRPVMNVSWYDAVDYCNWLSEKEGLAPVYSGQGDSVVYDFRAGGYRLPTEQEWEFAARGGLESRGYLYSGSNMINSAAWYYNNSGNRPRLVGQKGANELGLYDMSGNVAEWCWDMYGSYQPGGTTKTGGERVIRGGSWYSFAGYVRSTVRGGSAAASTSPYVGFRLARTAR